MRKIFLHYDYINNNAYEFFEQVKIKYMLNTSMGILKNSLGEKPTCVVTLWV